MERFLKRRGIAAGCVAGLALLTFLAGCDPSFNLSDLKNGDSESSRPGDQQPQVNVNYTQYSNSPNGNSPPPQLIMGSFNIQYFGETKMSRPQVVNILVDIVRRFDIIAIQELRGDDSIMYEFLNQLNADGSQFRATVSEPQGYYVNGRLSNYREKAAYIYDASKLELVRSSYIAPNPNSAMQRAPFIGHFRCTNYPPEVAFSFVMANVHTTPDPAITLKTELEAFRDVIGFVYRNHAGEDDVIVLGDFNEEPDRFNQLGWMQTQFAAIPSSWKTNLVQTECYDNLIFDANHTSEFTGQAGVFNFQNEYGLTQEQAKLVSDHFPVWALFSSKEQFNQAMMTQNPSSQFLR
ncbi:MAG: endonuclease/exonuclease/phosphatase family protein [Planctomycetota bacterium]